MATLTGAQRAALAVLARAALDHRLVGISTGTTPPDAEYPSVQTQVATSLIGKGLATRDGACLVLTDAGQAQAAAEAARA